MTNFKRIMQNNNIMVKQLAILLDCSTQNIVNWRKGAFKPNIDFFEKLRKLEINDCIVFKDLKVEDFKVIQSEEREV